MSSPCHPDAEMVGRNRGDQDLWSVDSDDDILGIRYVGCLDGRGRLWLGSWD